MSIRRETIYISTDTWKACLMIAKASSIPHAQTTVTADLIADRLLREAISEHYPQAFEHQKKIDQLEKELLKDLGKRQQDTEGK